VAPSLGPAGVLLYFGGRSWRPMPGVDPGPPETEVVICEVGGPDDVGPIVMIRKVGPEGGRERG
jgi:hypothetical protein